MAAFFKSYRTTVNEHPLITGMLAFVNNSNLSHAVVGTIIYHMHLQHSHCCHTFEVRHHTEAGLVRHMSPKDLTPVCAATGQSVKELRCSFD